MDKQVKNKLTLLQLIKEKDKYEVKKGEIDEIYIERLDATILFENPERSLAIESIEMSQDEDMDSGAGDIHLIYNSVVEPNLKDSALQEAYNCVEPTDILDKLFKPGEIAAIAQEIMKSAGYGTHVKKVKQVKN